MDGMPTLIAERPRSAGGGPFVGGPEHFTTFPSVYHVEAVLHKPLRLHRLVRRR